MTAFAVRLAANLHGLTTANGAYTAIRSLIPIFFFGNFRSCGIRHDANSRRELISDAN
jgi:hypothetical protein